MSLLDNVFLSVCPIWLSSLESCLDSAFLNHSWNSESLLSLDNSVSVANLLKYFSFSCNSASLTLICSSFLPIFCFCSNKAFFGELSLLSVVSSSGIDIIRINVNPSKIITDHSKAVVLLWFSVACFFGDVSPYVWS